VHGIIVRVDGAGGHTWVTQALFSSPDEDADAVQQLIRQQHESYVIHGLDWPGDNAVRAALRMFTDQARARLHTGPADRPQRRLCAHSWLPPCGPPLTGSVS
jgi:hypothetical protein